MLAREVRILSESIERLDGRGFLKVVSADQRTAGGERPSCLICDEIGYYGSWSLIAENSPGPEQLESLVLYLGFRGPKAYNRAGCPLHDLVARAAAGDPALYLLDRQEHPTASAEFLARMRRQLPASEFARVWENTWSDEGAFLPSEWIAAAVDPGLARGVERDPAARYFMGVDLGLRRDATAVAVVEIPPMGDMVRLVALCVWRGAGREAEVDLANVEETILELDAKFQPQCITYDPWQFGYAGQRLKGAGLPVNEYVLTQASKNQIASILYALFAERMIRIPPRDDLRTELEQLVLKETKVGGIYFDHLPGRHDDMVMAIGLAVSVLEPGAVEPVGFVSNESFLDGYW